MSSQLLPSLVHYDSEEKYYDHFRKMYCDSRKPIYTFDNIRVSFYPTQFKHAFHKSLDRAKGDKSIFSIKRAERIDWIKWALGNQNAKLYQGWDREKRCYTLNRRVCMVDRNYIVIIQFIQLKSSQRKAFFITAFLADSDRSFQQIIRSPAWHT